MLLALCIAAALAAAFILAQQSKPKARPLLTVTKWCNFDIVGEASYQPALMEAYRGEAGENGGHTTATLHREPTNPHDSNAVCVKIAGRTVGYLARDDAEALSKYLTSHQLERSVIACPAWINGGFIDDDGKLTHLGVKLGISWPPQLAK